MMFFTGLHSLLTMVAQRRVLLAATRVESVKARLHVMGGAIRAVGGIWAGRTCCYRSVVPCQPVIIDVSECRTQGYWDARRDHTRRVMMMAR